MDTNSADTSSNSLDHPSSRARLAAQSQSQCPSSSDSSANLSSDSSDAPARLAGLAGRNDPNESASNGTSDRDHDNTNNNGQSEASEHEIDELRSFGLSLLRQRRPTTRRLSYERRKGAYGAKSRDELTRLGKLDRLLGGLDVCSQDKPKALVSLAALLLIMIIANLVVRLTDLVSAKIVDLL